MSYTSLIRLFIIALVGFLPIAAIENSRIGAGSLTVDQFFIEGCQTFEEETGHGPVEFIPDACWEMNKANSKVVEAVNKRLYYTNPAPQDMLGYIDQLDQL